MPLRYDSACSFYKIPTPQNAPLRAGLGEFYRFKTRPICVRCGTAFPQDRPLIVQLPKYEVSGTLLVMRQIPCLTDERIMEEFVVRACETGVGCWANCRCGKNWNMKCRNNCVARGVIDQFGMLARPGDCPCICTCLPKCGNRKIYPCRCGHSRIYHAPGCPVGDFKRDSSFLLPLIRRRMLEAGRRRYR